MLKPSVRAWYCPTQRTINGRDKFNCPKKSDARIQELREDFQCLTLPGLGARVAHDQRHRKDCRWLEKIKSRGRFPRTRLLASPFSLALRNITAGRVRAAMNVINRFARLYPERLTMDCADDDRLCHCAASGPRGAAGGAMGSFFAPRTQVFAACLLQFPLLFSLQTNGRP